MMKNIWMVAALASCIAASTSAAPTTNSIVPESSWAQVTVLPECDCDGNMESEGHSSVVLCLAHLMIATDVGKCQIPDPENFPLAASEDTFIKVCMVSPL